MAEGEDARDAARRAARYHPRVLQPLDAAAIARELERTASDPEGVGIMTAKGRIQLVRLDHVPLRAAPLLKQEMLAVGGDSAHARGIADHSVEETAVVLLGTSAQYRRLIEKLRRQPFGLPGIGAAVEAALQHHDRRAERTVRGHGRPIPVGGHCRIMGVINVTPDSFSDGGRFLDPEAAIARAVELAEAGAELLDLGAESTRPGATEVAPATEWGRLAPVLAGTLERVRGPISVDTRHAEVAAHALDAGADLINDVSGLRDPAMRRLLARTGAPAILMHMRGTPTTMQQRLEYAELRGEVYAALAEAAAAAIEDGIAPEQLLVDPGLGFGKSAEQNLELLGHLGEFRSLGYPIVVGASRKSFLASAHEGAPPEARGEAGLAAAVIAALEGADYVRTHDVVPTARALRLVEAVRRGRRVEDAERPPAGPD